MKISKFAIPKSKISQVYSRNKMKSPLFFFSVLVLLCSCKVTEQNIAGTYQLKGVPRTKLVLNKDKTFEFVKNFAEPGPVFFPDSTDMNFRTRGLWQLENDKVVLTSFPPSIGLNFPGFTDSVLQQTSITSISFWDKYGDPVTIRFIKFLPDKIKFYRGNTISFFREDFNVKDTLEFHFYGYKPVKWSGNSLKNLTDNQSHRFTLYEEERAGYFNNVILSAEKKKLIGPDKAFALYKN